MEKLINAGTRLDEALTLLGYSVTGDSSDGVFKVVAPDGTEAGKLTPSDCWAYLHARHRELFEASLPI